ncbi:pentatricopeptide repeat-containing protein At5g66520-like [Magnolia sinica]|uniref:pentatricopeptide repeat-containing protein At5g66520-like n=1 Tax=Magnolia sinica TaxID=86752 RepID=UPI002658B4D6|nr:pentatricopeptide repeat-containing protein At5g66520-like [Magnolia sinica]
MDQLLNSRCVQQHIFSLLESCKCRKKLSQIHAQILVNGFSQKKFLLSKLISSCISSGNLLHAHVAFHQIHNPTTVLYNHMIRGFARSSTPHHSFLLYNQMKASHAQKPDSFTYSFLLTSCSTPSFSIHGQQLHGIIVSTGFSSCIFVLTNLINMYIATSQGNAVADARRVFDDMPLRNTATWNSMIAGYLRCGDADAARRMFDDMPERNVISWTTVIAGCAQSGRCKQALLLFHEMQKARVEPDQVAMVAALSACAEFGDLKSGRWIHAFIDEVPGFKQPRLVSLNNALIHMYAKCGVIEEAHRIFEEMPQRSVISWTTMITGFAMHGRGEDALSVFKRMQSMGVRPDEITFIGVLCACSHAGWVDEGRRCFDHMIRVCHITPRIEHYGCMVDLLSRAGLLDEANKLIDTMPIEPNDVVWGALLGGCRIHKDVELASHVGGQLTELEPDRAAGYLVLLSNVYAAAKRWDDVARVRGRMVQMGVKKPVGRSWIEVNGVIHDFVAGDQTHGQAAAIYKMVDEIMKQAKLAGHIPDTSQVLLDVEEEERESFLHFHSEKLAIAFGLISISDEGIPIQIVKNLRICTDCHSTVKFVSKAFNREISIRDRNRFHHFRGGICSCRDYW